MRAAPLLASVSRGKWVNDEVRWAYPGQFISCLEWTGAAAFDLWSYFSFISLPN
jgi:hypothetical protein